VVALHALRSAAAIEHAASREPRPAIVVALTGTDLYSAALASDEGIRSLKLADRLIVLQPAALNTLPPEYVSKARVIVQSVSAPQRVIESKPDRFEVCVMAHLRSVKDPLLAARAARLLPSSSRIHVIHLGAALDAELADAARAEQDANPRYTWVGNVPHGQALARLAGCRLLVLTSQLEGGANAVSEALVAGVPVVSTEIDGSIGILGKAYPGYFPVGDATALSELLLRCERDAEFLAALAIQGRELALGFSPALEERRWVELLADLRLPSCRACSEETRPS
jgi:putative glycosyltransferase (TIGR04348 family)